jgi:Fe-S cluster biogenesis protein NfuA
VPTEVRVVRAIDKVRPQLQKQGGGVDLLGVSDGAVHISIRSSGNGCHSSPDAIKQAVEQAILEAAPEVVEIVADGLPASGAGFVPLNMLQPVVKEERHEESAA